jgi:succinyl-CoA synthetase alpha subunit
MRGIEAETVLIAISYEDFTQPGVVAALAGVDQSTISRMESTGHRPVKGHAGTVDAVMRALEAKGVVIEQDGVRLRKPRR